jgi:hypothetical protein
MVMVVMMAMMMMVRLRKCRSREEHDRGQQQNLFHVRIIATTMASPMPLLGHPESA